MESREKIDRVLGIYTRLLNGQCVNKKEEAIRYNVNERSIQRDIDDIRGFLENEALNKGCSNSVIYSREKRAYILENTFKVELNNSEILAICKILLQTRAFTKNEMHDLLKRLITCCVPKSNRDKVSRLIQNEEFHYIEPKHKKVFLNDMWTLAKAINSSSLIRVIYRKNDDTQVERKLKPLAIMFSEHYFYLTAFIDEKDEVREHFDVINDAYPTIYRIDRMLKIEVLSEKFKVPYGTRFEEGEFLKRVQFMYGGKIRKIKFKCNKPNLEAILDRLPTAQIESEEDGIYTIKAEVFGNGVDMWIRSQGRMIEMVEER